MGIEKIMIVGAGFGQLPAIESAISMGLEVIVVDKNPDAIGMKRATHGHCCDVVDFKGVLDLAIKYKIDGIMTMQSDLPVPTIGYVNDALGLKGVSLEVANVCSNKIETRRKLHNMGCSQPEFMVVKNVSEAESAASIVGFPCIIKAPDSSGSRGVVKCRTAFDIKSAMDEAFKYTNGNELLVEEYIEGLEFGAQTFSVDGECKQVLLHNDTISNPPYMIPVGHSFPFKYLSEDERTQAISDIKNAVMSVGLENGPANVDLILDKNNNRVKIIEIGARIGATCLPELVKYHTGIDWVKETLLSSLGKPVNLDPKFYQPVAALIVQSPVDGRFLGYSMESEMTEGLLEFEVTAKENDSVSVLRKGTDRIGKVVILSDTVESAESKAEVFLESLIINVDPQ